jgi:hypothetical protein
MVEHNVHRRTIIYSIYPTVMRRIIWIVLEQFIIIILIVIGNTRRIPCGEADFRMRRFMVSS